MEFDDPKEANWFLDIYVSNVFAGGRSGRAEDYWWGCKAGGELTVHHYVVES
jgi:hypothetical protein